MGSLTIVFFYLLFCTLVGGLFSSKGHSFFRGFIGSLLLSPLVGFIIGLIIRPSWAKEVKKGKLKKCPHCAELIKAEAVVCRYCGRDLPAVQPAQVVHRDRRLVMGGLILGFVFLGIVLGHTAGWGAILPLVLVAIGTSIWMRPRLIND